MLLRLSVACPRAWRAHGERTAEFVHTLQVSFEVFAPESGVVKSVAVKVNDNVVVGAEILVIDTEGVEGAAAPAASSAAATSAPAAPLAAAPAASPVPAAAAAVAHHAGRKPSIHFRYGKRDRIAAEPAAPEFRSASASAPAPAARAPAAAAAASIPAVPVFPPSKASKTFLDTPALFGRPPISSAEADAILSGGAY
ncbi:hypothetical protein EON67_09690 [archaeon]|nr:MAG: hypothetical protein EON67_09690 [archaeon]